MMKESGLKAKMSVLQPGLVLMQATFTMSLRDWEIVAKSLKGDDFNQMSPSTALTKAIGEMVEQVKGELVTNKEIQCDQYGTRLSKETISSREREGAK